MNIVVLMKQTFDTEEKIQLMNATVVEDGVRFVMNPYDEYAVEEAVCLRDAHGGKVTVLSVGPERTAEALRTALAMGADEAVLLCDERIGIDELAVSKALAAYLNHHDYDLILGGNFSVDHGAGQVAIRLASLLGIPHVGSITKLEVDQASANVKAICERDAEGDVEIVEVQLPALLTAQQGLNEPRYPSLPGIMKAKRKPFQQLALDDLGIDPTELSPAVQRLDIALPSARRAGRKLEGELHDQVRHLVQLLRDEDKVI